jgi:hypothetical protein
VAVIPGPPIRAGLWPAQEAEIQEPEHSRLKTALAHTKSAPQNDGVGGKSHGAPGVKVLGRTRHLHGGYVRDKMKALLRTQENTEPEEKRDGYQIDDGAGDNSHGQTGVAAGTFAGNSLFVGNSTRTSL